LPYAEIQLDGNVHFIGTQGVGKSTLLRSILFFYTADTQKLDIPRGNKTYSEYYFHYPNSYIIYEVITETGPYCVLTYKDQGRVAFRFINTAYDSRFFIDSENKAYSSWGNIRDGLGMIRYTKKMSSYEEYRNVLYGNTAGMSAEFRKYALLNSKQYQNIPRTIANVFLNSKLDADFIKQTIIQSLNEEEINIDLETYSQKHLVDFENQINDVSKWLQKDKQGKNQLIEQAKKVIELYRQYNFKEQEERSLSEKLGWAMYQIKEEKPELIKKEAALSEEEEKLQKRRRNFREAFQKREKKLEGEIAILERKLKDLAERKTKYEQLQITGLLARVAQKDRWEKEKFNLEQEKITLNAQYAAIEDKYNNLIEQVKNTLENFKNEINAKKNELTVQQFTFQQEVEESYAKIISDIEKQHQEELNLAEEERKQKENQIHENKIKATEIKHKRFFEKEIGDFKTQQQNLIAENSDLKNAAKEASIEKSGLQKDWEREKERMVLDAKNLTEKETQKTADLQNSLEKIDAKLAKRSGSLYEWLNQEMPNWEENIGKVIDENLLFYDKPLSPQKTESDILSFYGIKIDNGAIDKKVQSETDLTEEKTKLENEIGEQKKKLERLQIELQEDLGRLDRRFKPKIKVLSDENKTRDYQIGQNEKKLDEIIIDLKDWEEKAQVEKSKQKKVNKEQLLHLEKEKEEIADKIRRINNRISRKAAEKNREKDEKLGVEEHRIRLETEKLDADFKHRQKEFILRTKELERQKNQKLQEDGADMKRLAEIDKNLTEIELELDFIDSNRDTVVEYQKDKRELFDKEDEFKNERYVHKKDLQSEAEQFHLKDEEYKSELETVQKKKNELDKKLNSIENQLNDYTTFSQTELYNELREFIHIEASTEIISENTSNLINQIVRSNNTKIRKFNGLREDIHLFVGNFQVENIFRFPVNFLTNANYFEFAENLEEFIEEDKIREYKTRVETRFAEIINHIGKETGDLIAKSGEISKVIRDINSDFKERNFVGAIESIQLQIGESKNKIFQLLVTIKDFNDEQRMNLGGINLFSTDDNSHQNQKAVELLKDLIKEMRLSRKKEIVLSDSFELLFRIVENENDSGWVERLTNVGSQGTDVLAKAMINIMLINVFKQRAVKKSGQDFRLHCMLDEIGRLHPTNVQGILRFANDRNILLINGSPTTYNAADYRYTYLLTRNANNKTKVTQLVKKKTAIKSGIA